MSTLSFRVDAEKCVRCDACVKDCPREIIHRKGSVPEAVESVGESCLECQHCLAVCPSGAISVFGLNPEDSLPLNAAAIPSLEQMTTLVRGRRSVRQFHDGDVPSELVNELLADIAHAPTGCNDRDLTFSVVSGREAMRRLREKVVAAIEARMRSGEDVAGFIVDAVRAHRNGGGDGFFRGAPHLLIVSPGEKATCGREDTVLALAYFELLAQSAGLGTTWCGMIKLVADAVPEIRPLLGLPPDVYFYAMVFGNPAVRYARTVQRASAARIRWIGEPSPSGTPMATKRVTKG